MAEDLGPRRRFTRTDVIVEARTMRRLMPIALKTFVDRLGGPGWRVR